MRTEDWSGEAVRGAGGQSGLASTAVGWLARWWAVQEEWPDWWDQEMGRRGRDAGWWQEGQVGVGSGK